MKAFVIKVIPTKEITEDGYKKARLIIDDKEYGHIDSFKTEGFVSFDFECDEGIQIWNLRPEGLEIEFRDSLNVVIRAL